MVLVFLFLCEHECTELFKLRFKVLRVLLLLILGKVLHLRHSKWYEYNNNNCLHIIQNLSKIQMPQILRKMLLRARIGSLLSAETSPHPLFFFLILALAKLNFFTLQSFASSLFVIGFVFVISKGYNYYFYCSPIIGSGMVGVSWLGGLLGVLWANRTWKMYLFLFLLAQSFVSFDMNFQNIYEVTISGYILIKIYHGFIFENLKDNQYFFAGFFTIAFVSLFEFIERNSFQHREMNVENKLIIIPFLIFLGYSAIKSRCQKLFVDGIFGVNLFKNPGVLMQHVEMVGKKIESNCGLISFMTDHNEKCNTISCFCQKYPEINLEWIDKNCSETHILRKQVRNSIFQKFILQQESSQESDRILSTHNYLLFLIESDQLNRVVHILYDLNKRNDSYFEMLSRLKVRERLMEKLEALNYYDERRNKYHNIYECDYFVGYINKEIREVLFHKVKFWREIANETPKLKELEEMGRKLVERIENLHNFYMLRMRPCEEALFNFNCSIIYATYLLTTTNYTEFATSLLKRNQQCIEEQKKTKISDSGLSYGLRLRLEKSVDRKENKLIELVIDNISGSLASILKSEKKNLINQKLKSIIPKQFQTIHENSFNNFLSRNSFGQSRSPFIRETLELPFLVKDKQIVFLKLTCRFYLDPLGDDTCLQCILSFPSNDCINFLADGNGKVLYQDNFRYDFLTEDEVFQKNVENLKSQYEFDENCEEIVEKQEKTDATYTYIFSGFFIKKFKQLKKEPIFRIKVENQNFKKENNEIDQLEINQKVKEVQKLEVRQDNQSEASTGSTKDSIENILLVLKDSSSFRMQFFLTVLLVVLLIAGISSFLTITLTFQIQNNSDMYKSPVLNTASFGVLKSYWERAMAWKKDQVQEKRLVQTGEATTLRLVSFLYFPNTFPSTATATLQYLFESERNLVNKFILGDSMISNKESESFFNKKLRVMNPLTVSWNATVEEPEQSQTMSIQSILINFIVDSYNLYLGEPYESTILSFKYLSELYSEISEQVINGFSSIEKRRAELKMINIIVICLIEILLLLFIIPIWKLSNFQKHKHEKIYSVLTSLDAKLISEEMEKLKKVEGQVFMYRINLENNYRKTETQNTISNKSIKAAKEKNEDKEQKRFINLSVILNGLKKMTADEMIETYKEDEKLKLRKRVGDLDLEGSDCDRKKCLLSHWLILFFLLLFLGLNLNSFFLKLHKLEIVDSYLNITKQTLDIAQNRSIILLNSKIFYDDYTEDNLLSFQGQKLPDWLLSAIQDFNVLFDQVDVSVKECFEDLLICRLKYSDVMLDNLILKTIVDAYEVKVAQLANSSAVSSGLYSKIRFELLYAQQVNDFLMKGLELKFMGQFNALSQKQLEVKKKREKLQVGFWCFVFAFIVFSVGYVTWVKNKYVKEVTLLSFLNKEMVFGNKRIESFVKNLSRSFR